MCCIAPLEKRREEKRDANEMRIRSQKMRRMGRRVKGR
jgi:hypothetical protein